MGVLQNVLDKTESADKKKAGKHQSLLGLAMGKMKVPGFKHGGKVKKTGIYKLHKGEKVLTARQAKSHPGLDC